MTQPGKTLLYQDPVNRQHPINRGLVAWWLHLPGRFGGGGLRLRDLLGKNHGTLTNMGADAWRGPGGRRGGYGSLAFNGTDDYVPTGLNPSAKLGQEFTVSAWVFPTAAANYRGACGYHEGGGTGFQFAQYQNDFLSAGVSAGWAFSYGKGGGSFAENQTLTTSEVPLGDWTHVACVFRCGTSMRLYADGQFVRSQTVLGSIVHATAFDIGRAFDGANRYWQGQLDGVKVHARALSDGEVYALYEDSLRGYPDTLRWLPNRTWFVPAAAPAGDSTFQAVWAVQANQLIGGGCNL